MKINDEVYIHGYVDEIRKDTIIIRNDGGYFGTVKNETKPKADITDRLLDCIMADIRKLSPEPTAEDVIDGNQIKDAIWEILLEVLQIIDGYKVRKCKACIDDQGVLQIIDEYKESEG